MRRYKGLLGLLVVLALVATACGDAEEATEPSDDVTEEPDEVTEEPDDDTEGEPEATDDDREPVTLTFWDNQQADTGLSEFQQTAIGEFQDANPHITIEVETVPYADYQQRLTLAVEGGNPPDIATLDQIWMAQFADSGAIIPLDDRVAESGSVNQENFFPGAWDSAIWDDEVWGIPFNVDVWQFTYYNEELLSDAGVEPEQLETWDGLRAAGEALTGDGQYGIGLFGHAYESLTVVMNSFVFSNGGDVIGDDGQCALDEPASVEALEYLDSLKEFAPAGILGQFNEDMRELFLNGALATEWWPALEQPTLQGSDIGWDFVVGTAPEGQTPVGTYGGWNLAVFSGAENPDAAWEFIEFLTDPSVNPRVVDLIPANVEAAETFLAENREGPDRILEHLENARARPLLIDYLQISEIQMEMMQKIFDGTPAVEAAEDACSEIDALN